jgi:hypothetical protein
LRPGTKQEEARVFVSAAAGTGKYLRPVLVWVGLGLVLVLLVHLGSRLTEPGTFGYADYVAYWSSGRLSALGEDAYDIEQLSEQQTAVGWQNDAQTPQGRPQPIIMYNPPWSLTWFMPFGLLPYGVSRLLWLVLELAVVLFCADRLWLYYEGPVRYRWLAWLLCFTFVPTLIVLNVGQLGPVLLLGVVGFLAFEKRQQSAWAGAAVALIAIKYYLFYLVLLAIFIWAVEHRRWSMFAGGILAIAVATAAPLLRDPLVFTHCADAMVQNGPNYTAPTIGTVLRFLFGPERSWLQLLPPLAGAIWFTFYWRQHRRQWMWAEQMPLLLLVSFLTTPYGAWAFDLVVLLVPVMQMAVGLWLSRQRQARLGAVLVYVAVNALALTINLLSVDYLWFIWMTPTLLIVYLVLRRQVKLRAGMPEPVAA